MLFQICHFALLSKIKFKPTVSEILKNCYLQCRGDYNWGQFVFTSFINMYFDKQINVQQS